MLHRLRFFDAIARKHFSMIQCNLVQIISSTLFGLRPGKPFAISNSHSRKTSMVSTHPIYFSSSCSSPQPNIDALVLLIFIPVLSERTRVKAEADMHLGHFCGSQKASGC